MGPCGCQAPLPPLALWWDGWPHRIEMQESTEALIEVVAQRLLVDRLVKAGEHVVMMGGLPMAGRARTNFM